MTKQRPTLNEVAKAANVSPMTVSRAINNRSGVSEQTREHILQVAAKLGYVVNRAAQKLSGGRSHIIGIIAADLENPFISAVVTGASEGAWAAGYEAIVYSQVDREIRPSGGMMQLLGQLCDGVIAVLPLEYGYLGDLSAIKLPITTIDHGAAHVEFPSITTDSSEGSRIAIRYLAELGHQRIAFIAGDERLSSAQDRHCAYLEIVAQLGLDKDEELVVAGNFSQESGFVAAQKLLALPCPPTAIFAANDLTAFGAIAAIREAGLRVPEDISVLGFDDIPAAQQFYPPLSTIRQPLQQMGRSAVNTLLAGIAGIDPVSRQVSLPTELIIRASTAAPRK